MYPVAVIGFNRPEYLRQTLSSLVLQEGVALRRIALFLDGLKNPFSNKEYGKEVLHKVQVAMFRSLFPQGEVFVAKQNIGIAFQMEAAENWVFDTCKADTGFFFEDDMVLSPHYLFSLQNMLEANKDDERVGYCACYGPLWKCPPAAANSYVPMHLNWAFALRRHQWEKSKPYVNEFLDLLRDVDYRDRPMGKIMELRERWGWPGVYTTQDVMRAIASRKTGGIRLNCRASLGRYIGARGLHIDPQAYEQAGFAKVQIYPHPLTDFKPVDEKMVAWCIDVTDQFVGTARYFREHPQQGSLAG
jgi:hypothetical protein